MSITQPAPLERLSVSALAKRIGVGPDTIRYYEKAGLLPTPERTAADYRAYDEAAVDRLRFIQGAQRLGLRLREIKTLLGVRDTGQCPCEPAEQLLRGHIAEIDREQCPCEPAEQLLRGHIAEIDREMRRLRALRAELVVMADRLPSPACPDPAPGTWRPRRTGKGG